MAYQNLKTYMQEKYKDMLRKEILDFINSSSNIEKGEILHEIIVQAVKCKIENENKWEEEPIIQMNINIEAKMIKLEDKCFHKVRGFVIYTRVKIKNQIEFIDDVTVIEECNPNMFKASTIYEEFLIPIIESDEMFENKVDDFWKKFDQNINSYYGNSIYEVPIGAVLNKLQINAFEADLPENILGRIYFRKDELQSYYDKIRIQNIENIGNIEIKRTGIEECSILINKNSFFMHDNGGTRQLTFTHEIAHWCFHRMFFAILSLLGTDEKMLNCNVEPQKCNDTMTDVERALWIVEEQANNIGFRMAMPRNKYIEVFNKIEKDIPKWGVLKGEVYESIIEKIAKVFKVSVFSAKQRAIQIGYEEALGTCIFVDGQYYFPLAFKKGILEKNQTFIIDKKSFNKLCTENNYFNQLIQTEKFVYVGYVVCINDSKYIQYTNENKYDLTDYAREHVDECCLIFNYEQIGENYIHVNSDFYEQCYLSRNKTDGDKYEICFRTQESENYRNITARKEEENIERNVIKYKEEYEEQSKNKKEFYRLMVSEKEDTSTFGGFLKALLNQKDDMNGARLANKIHVSEVTVSSWVTNKSIPKLENVLAICLVLKLPEIYCEYMLEQAGIFLSNDTKAGFIYRKLMKYHMEKGSISEWNKYLTKFGLEPICSEKD